MKKGQILSETQFYTVKEVQSNGNVIVTDDDNREITLGAGYIKSGILATAEDFSSTEEKTATELAEIFIGSPRVAMSVEFYKKDTAKTKTALKKEIQTWTENVKDEFLRNGISAIEKYATQPVLPYTPGEYRVMKGRHYGSVDEFGRVHFVDMEQDKGTNPDYDARLRQVDPRTIQALVIEGVRYVLKKK